MGRIFLHLSGNYEISGLRGGRGESPLVDATPYMGFSNVFFVEDQLMATLLVNSSGTIDDLNVVRGVEVGGERVEARDICYISGLLVEDVRDVELYKLVVVREDLFKLLKSQGFSPEKFEDKIFIIFPDPLEDTSIKISTLDYANPISLFKLYSNLAKSEEERDFELISQVLKRIFTYVVQKDIVLEEKEIFKFLLSGVKFENRGGFKLSLKEDDEVLIVGDLHGDLNALMGVFDVENVTKRLVRRDENFYLIFLGDYIDRGRRQINVLRSVLVLKYLFPDRVFLLRGNHEEVIVKGGGSDVKFSSAEDKEDDLTTFVGRWENEFRDVLLMFKNFFEKIPLVARLDYGDKAVLLLHGGVPHFFDGDDPFPYFASWEEFVDAISRGDIKSSEIIWSRRKKVETLNFQNGVKSFEYGKRQVEAFLQKLSGEILIRGHDPVGFETTFDEQLITIHTTGGRLNIDTSYPYLIPTYIKIRGKEMVANRLLSGGVGRKMFLLTKKIGRW